MATMANKNSLDYATTAFYIRTLCEIAKEVCEELTPKTFSTDHSDKLYVLLHSIEEQANALYEHANLFCE